MGSPATNPVPKRLIRSQGRWVLEIEELVPFKNNILRPVLKKVEGEENILVQLEGSAEGRALAPHTSKLLRSVVAQPGEEKSFEVGDGAWIPTAARPQRISRRPGADGIGGDPTPIQRQLAVVEIKTERLAKRLFQLEKRPDPAGMLADLTEQIVSLKETQNALLARISVLEDKLAKGVFVTQAERPEEQEQAAVVEETPKANWPFKMPELEAMSQAVGTLLGDAAVLRETKKPIKLGPKATDLFVSKLLDDDGNVVGAFVADLRATVYLGGLLMMLPSGELESQIKAKQPSEDVIAAVAETFNMLSGQINLVDGNEHVRSSYTEPYDPNDLAWASNPGRRFDLEDSFGGKLTVLAKNP